MNKFITIFCFILLISASLAKQATKNRAADTAAEIKDKVVETVCYILCIVFLYSVNISFLYR